MLNVFSKVMSQITIKSTAAEASGTFVPSVYEAECGRSFEEITQASISDRWMCICVYWHRFINFVCFDGFVFSFTC